MIKANGVNFHSRGTEWLQEVEFVNCSHVNDHVVIP